MHLSIFVKQCAILTVFLFLMFMPSLKGITGQDMMLLAIGAVTAWNSRRSGKRDEQVASIKATGEATHILSNSAMGAQLKLNVSFARAVAVMAHRVATITKEDGDLASAEAADIQVHDQEAILQLHLIQQAKVDARDAKEATRA